MKRRSSATRHAALLLALFAPVALAADPAAEINMITGKGTASAADGDIRQLVKGSAVYSGELVSSGPNSYVNLKFTDGGFTLIRPNSRFHLEQYAFGGAPPAAPTVLAPAAPKPAAPARAAPQSSPTPSRALFRLFKGGFRTVTGLIGKLDRNEYEVRTPVATIGIRGTDYTAVICDAACAADPVVRSELTEGLIAEGGLIVGVIDGVVEVDSGGRNCDDLGSTGACRLTASQYLLVAADGTQVRLERAPRFLEVDPVPNPATCAP